MELPKMNTPMLQKNRVLAALSLVLLAGCANPGVMQSSALNYNTAQAQQAQQVQTGTVIAVLPVNIAPATTGIGTLGGAAAGATLGSDIGGGRGSTAMALIGALAGGVAGSAIEGRALAQQGYQITVRLDNGQTVAVTQAADVSIHVGQRVQMIGGGWGGQPARVLPID
jgi:outer membrane lipoprotein SlyB